VTGFQVIALLATVTAVFSYLNHRFLKLPPTIGVIAFVMLSEVALEGGHGSGAHIGMLFLQEAIGGSFRAGDRLDGVSDAKECG